MTRFDLRRSQSARLAIASAAVAAVALAQAAPVVAAARSAQAAPASTAVVHVMPRPAGCGAPLTVCIRIPA